MKEPIRVVIADDDETVRKQIRKLVDGQMNLAVVAEAASGREAIVLVKEHHPGILLLDITMLPGMDGLQVLKCVRHDHPAIHVVMISQLTDRDLVDKAQELGARGYVAKRDLAVELLLAIERVMAGGSFLSRAVNSERTIVTTTARETRAANTLEAKMTKEHHGDTGGLSVSTLSRKQDNTTSRETERIRVLVLDDDPVVVQAIRAMLAKDSLIQLVGSDEDVCKNMETAVVLIKQHAPHVVVLDLNLRGYGRGGWRVVRRMAEKYSHIRVILCTVDTDQKEVGEAWREGIEGYVPKMRLQELMQAIHTVHSGKPYFSPSLGDRVWRPSKETIQLGSREREVFYLFVRDRETEEIMDEMGIGDDAVHTHMNHIRQKIGHQYGWKGVASEVRKGGKTALRYSALLSDLNETERRVFEQYIGRWDDGDYVGGKTAPEDIGEALCIPVGEVKALIGEIRYKLAPHHPDGWKRIAKEEGDID